MELTLQHGELVLVREGSHQLTRSAHRPAIEVPTEPIGSWYWWYSSHLLVKASLPLVLVCVDKLHLLGIHQGAIQNTEDTTSTEGRTHDTTYFAAQATAKHVTRNRRIIVVVVVGKSGFNRVLAWFCDATQTSTLRFAN